MNAVLIAFRYARALYDFSKEAGEETVVLDELRQIREQLLAVPDFLPTLQSPLVDGSVKLKLMRMAVGDTSSTSLERFFQLLVSHQRENSMLDICRAFKRVYDKEKGIVKVRVTTAVPLDSEQQNTFKLKLEASSGKKIELRFMVNPEIIGGYVLTTEEKRLDASVKNQLQTIQHKLTI